MKEMCAEFAETAMLLIDLWPGNSYLDYRLQSGSAAKNSDPHLQWDLPVLKHDHIMDWLQKYFELKCGCHRVVFSRSLWCIEIDRQLHKAKYIWLYLYPEWFRANKYVHFLFLSAYHHVNRLLLLKVTYVSKHREIRCGI